MNWIYFVLGYGPVADCCEGGIELSGLIKGGKFTE